ncbi:HesA/MoeB/ThiF family protein [Pseudodesulfovibrio cashew]|uniref:HesA/MoeB/ThiF family protein n=2 Tax=Pseudodesulfovibrio cashew TaxID=2678688 RepID=A0A6I6JPV7_9BACT|nr:HesA/MoeB/ThiF family protein [Pseudodesulfovibrio cashew]
MAIGNEHGVKGHVVEAKALSLGIHPARYLRNQLIIDIQHQAKLLESTIAQVGLGGLGGTLLEVFLRTGIGTIRGADGDTFEATNLNRQALSSPAALDRPKAEVAAERAEQLNPSVSFEAKNEFLDARTLPDFLDGADLAVDALGGLKTRPALQQAAADAGIPLVTGALAGWTGYVAVVMPGHEGPADIMGTDNGAEEKLGCPAPAVTFFAALMAAEAVKLLTTGQSELTSAMLIADLKTLSFDRILL